MIELKKEWEEEEWIPGPDNEMDWSKRRGEWWKHKSDHHMTHTLQPSLAFKLKVAGNSQFQPLLNSKSQIT